MKKMQRMIILVVMLLVGSVSVAFATDSCPSYKEVPGSAAGAYADYDITFPVWLAPGWAAVLKGNESPDGSWTYHKIVNVDPVKSTATARVFGWNSGEDIEFSTGKYDKGDLFPGVNLDNIVYWSDPTVCPELLYPKDAPPDDRRYRLKLGERFVPPEIPAISLLLLKGEEKPAPPPPPPPHQCAVLSVERTATHGEFGDYKIILSLQKFDPAAPDTAVPYVDRQTEPDYANVAWTGWHAVQRVDDTAVVEVKDWPITWSMRLSIKLMAGGVDYWQDMEDWLFTGCQTNYFSYTDGHFIIPLN